MNNLLLRKHFSNFKQKFGITISDNLSTKEKIDYNSSAFEKFVNYIIFSLEHPNIFTGETNLLDFISVGGSHDTGIDGIAIIVNDIIIKSIDDIKYIMKDKNQKIEYDFIFIQSKMQDKFDSSEFAEFASGVKHFLGAQAILPENEKIKEFRKIKEYLDTDEVNIKIRRNPNITLYYVSTGNPPTDQHFLGKKKITENEFIESYSFDEVAIRLIDGKKLINFCDELENNFKVRIEYLDSIPLLTGNNTDIKKAYTFTCTAEQYLKILTKEDDTLRRHLFIDNVRDYLGSKKEGSVNSEIEKSILETPDMFLLCNNGVTIVCSDFISLKDKLVEIDNPQIVNGCQTSNSIFKHRESPNIKQIKLLVRLICTESAVVSNKIVRGTNKQNQVLDEDFEITRTFHHNLELFFGAVENEPILYYERRPKQFNGINILNTHIINLKVLCESFTAIFLSSPHDAHKHKKIILDIYGGNSHKRKIFRDEHSEYPYYVSAVLWYMLEQYISKPNYKEFATYKWHLYLLFRLIVGEELPTLNKSYKIEVFCKKFLNLLKPEQFESNLKKVVEIFSEVRELWSIRGKSIHGIKDNKDFTSFLQEEVHKKFTKKSNDNKDKMETIYLGKIIRIIPKNDTLWFGFIECDNFPVNVYFDKNSFKGNLENLKPSKEVTFSILRSNEDNATAKEVTLKVTV